MGQAEMFSLRPLRTGHYWNIEENKGVAMQLAHYLGLLHVNEQRVAEAFRKVADHHHAEPDIVSTCNLLAGWSTQHVQQLKSLTEKYGEEKDGEPDNLISTLFHGPRSGGLGLIRDIHDLWLLTQEAHFVWTVLLQSALALRDKELEKACTTCGRETNRQIAWLRTRVNQASPQALVAT